MRVFIAVIFLTTVISSCFGGFSRSCTGPSCTFGPNKASNGQAYLMCTRENKCLCETDNRLADAPSWDVRNVNGKCLIATTGPCGEDDGLEIGCHPGNECIEGRCRDPDQLRTKALNYSCHSDIDCQTGLKCKIVAFYYNPVRKCVTPETPEYSG